MIFSKLILLYFMICQPTVFGLRPGLRGLATTRGILCFLFCFSNLLDLVSPRSTGFALDSVGWLVRVATVEFEIISLKNPSDEADRCERIINHKDVVRAQPVNSGVVIDVQRVVSPSYIGSYPFFLIQIRYCSSSTIVPRTESPRNWPLNPFT